MPIGRTAYFRGYALRSSRLSGVWKRTNEAYTRRGEAARRRRPPGGGRRGAEPRALSFYREVGATLRARGRGASRRVGVDEARLVAPGVRLSQLLLVEGADP